MTNLLYLKWVPILRQIADRNYTATSGLSNLRVSGYADKGKR